MSTKNQLYFFCLNKQMIGPICTCVPFAGLAGVIVPWLIREKTHRSPQYLIRVIPNMGFLACFSTWSDWLCKHSSFIQILSEIFVVLPTFTKPRIFSFLSRGCIQKFRNISRFSECRPYYVPLFCFCIENVCCQKVKRETK